MRRRLELYFERRNCASPDELADETLNRVARRLEEEGTIHCACPAQYCYIVAKLVFHESVRRASGHSNINPDDSLAMRRARIRRDAAVEANDDLLSCLEMCLGALPEADRELITEYYQGDLRAKIEHRRALANRLGLTTNALTIRACRLRDKLEACVKSRLSSK
jgi:DNA-directed RNA polymerase specialized sigma24 family protein